MPTCPNGHTTVATDYCDVCGEPMPAVPGADGLAGIPADASAEGPSVAAGPGEEPTAADGLAAAHKSCPNCQGANPVAALFCEACGYDFTTGALPRTAVPAPVLPEPLVVEPEPAPKHELEPVIEPEPEVVPEPVAVIEPEPTVVVESEPAFAPSAPARQGGPVSWVAEVWIDPDWYAGQDSPDQIPSPGLPRVVALRERASLVGRPSKSRGIFPVVDCDPDTGVSRRHAELSTDGSRWWVEDLGSSNGTFVGQPGAPLPESPIVMRTEIIEEARIYAGSWTRIVVRRATTDELEL